MENATPNTPTMTIEELESKLRARANTESQPERAFWSYGVEVSGSLLDARPQWKVWYWPSTDSGAKMIAGFGKTLWLAYVAAFGETPELNGIERQLTGLNSMDVEKEVA
jgi:hypothetical protein